MKKSLSLLVAIAMVFSMFAAVASAASEAGTKLQGLGIIQGDQNGDLLEESTWKRQDLAVLLSRLMGVEEEAQMTAKGHTYADVRGTYYDGFLTWAQDEGLMEGHSDVRFGFDEELTYHQFAAVVLRALGVDTTGEAYATVPELAVEAGLVAEGTDFGANAIRGATYVVIVEALDTEVAGEGKTLGQLLGLPGYEVTELALATVAQTGAKKITVNFNKEVTAEEKTDLTIDVKNGLVPYNVTPKWAEDNQSVVLEASFLPAGEYTITVGEFDAVTITVEAEKVSKIEIQATTLQKAEDQDLMVKALNQFNEVVPNAIADGNISVFNSKAGAPVAVASGKVDLDGADVDSVIIVTATHPVTGLTATKNFTLMAASSATSIQLGQVVPKEGSERISVSTNDYVLPYTMIDQYGASMKLPTGAPDAGATATNAKFDDVEFVVSPTGSTTIDLTSLSVDSDGVLTFDTSATAGTVVITVINSRTGASSNTTVVVQAAAVLKTFQANNPGVIVVEDEVVTVPYVATNTFDAPIAKADVPAAVTALGGNFNISDSSATIDTDVNWKANGDLELTFSGGTGPVTVFFWVSGAISSQISVDVKAEAIPQQILGTKDLTTTLTNGGSVKVEIGKLNVVDNYGRPMTALPGGYSLVFTEANDGAGAVDLTEADGTVTGTATNGNEVVTVGIDGPDAGTAADAGLTLNVTFTVVAADKVTTFEIASIGTVYADPGAGVEYEKEIKLSGKLADGTAVAIDQSAFATLYTSSNTAIANIANTSYVNGVAKGEATIAVWNEGEKLAETTVTVNDADPVVTSVSFNKASHTIAGADTTYDLETNLVVKDQYGVNQDKDGNWYSSNTAVATVDNDGNVTEAGAAVDGETTIRFVSDNGVSASIKEMYKIKE